MACDQIAIYEGNNQNPDQIDIDLYNCPLHLTLDPSGTAPGYTYYGCTTRTVNTNFRARLAVKITPAPGVDGEWAGTVTPEIVGPGAAIVQICVRVEHLDIRNMSPDIAQIATVTLLAVPVS